MNVNSYLKIDFLSYPEKLCPCIPGPDLPAAAAPEPDKTVPPPFSLLHLHARNWP